LWKHGVSKIGVQSYKFKLRENGEIIEKLQISRFYKIQIKNGKIYRTNVIHLRERKILNLEPPLYKYKFSRVSKILTLIKTNPGRVVKKI